MCGVQLQMFGRVERACIKPFSADSFWYRYCAERKSTINVLDRT